MAAVPTVPVLEIGGTHVSAAAVDTNTWRLSAPATRLQLRADGSADQFIQTLSEAAAAVGAPRGGTWGVAMPDPFDYVHGIAWFEGVGKFDALHGVDVGAALRARLQADVVFLNDADAFTLGEWVHGSGAGTHRCVGLTLGTGVGSGWVVDGQIVDPGVPPGGRAHHLSVGGATLEEFMSRRAIRGSYARRTGDTAADVLEISQRARAGDPVASEVLRTAVRALGTALQPAVAAFAADVLVVGGSMAGSWDLFEPWFRGDGIGSWPPIRTASDPDNAPLLGAAQIAARR
jgi:glucokinase